MSDDSRLGRRELMATMAGTAIAGSLIVQPAIASEDKRKKQREAEIKVTPPEDLMREHGVLDRVLLVYEAGIEKFASNQDFDPALLINAAGIVRDFIEDYHEKSEEEALFPRFRKAGKLVALVDTLQTQHRAGRKVTQTILRRAPGSRKDGDDRRELVTAIHSFIRMYRPHAAREDTELFPLLKDLVSPHEYDAMSEDFEKKEHQLFGEDGFEKMAHRIAELERSIGISDLGQFTPA